MGFAALLGLDDFRKDAFATGMHAYLLQKKYPYAEIAFSCPRLRPIINNDKNQSERRTRTTAFAGNMCVQNIYAVCEHNNFNA